MLGMPQGDGPLRLTKEKSDANPASPVLRAAAVAA